MGENICKWCNQQGVNFQNIQTTHTTQYQKNKQPNQKLGRRLEETFFSKMTQAKMLNIANYQRNANPNLIIREMQIQTTMR